jgi:hypothetical protein
MLGKFYESVHSLRLTGFIETKVFLVFYYIIILGYIVTFTKVLTMYLS